MLERLNIIRGIFGGHDGMGVLSGTLMDIPVDSLQSGTLLPQPPQIAARLLTGRHGCARLPIAPELKGELRLITERLERKGILLNLIPSDKEGRELGTHLSVRVRICGRLIFGMEEIAGAIGCGLIDNHRVWAEENTGASGTHNIFRSLVFGFLPQPYL